MNISIADCKFWLRICKIVSADSLIHVNTIDYQTNWDTGHIQALYNEMNATQKHKANG